MNSPSAACGGEYCHKLLGSDAGQSDIVSALTAANLTPDIPRRDLKTDTAHKSLFRIETCVRARPPYDVEAVGLKAMLSLITCDVGQASGLSVSSA